MTEATAVEDELKKHGAAASPKEVLDLKPNNAKPEGASPQVSQTLYTTWTKPDGSTFVAPASNADVYERKGYKKGADAEIPDLVAYQAERGQTEAPKTEHAHKAKSD